MNVEQKVLDQMGRAVTRRQLHHAQPVPLRPEPHGLRIHGHAILECEPGRQVVLVQLDDRAHGSLSRISNLAEWWRPGEDLHRTSPKPCFYRGFCLLLEPSVYLLCVPVASGGAAPGAW